MSKFIIEKTVNASIEKTFQVFSNYEMFPKIISRYYPSVIVRSRRGDVAVVAEHLRLLDKEFIIMAKHSVKQPNLHETVVVGGDIKGSYINEQFFAVPEGTKLKIEAELKLNLSQKLGSLTNRKKYDQAIIHLEKALNLNPSTCAKMMYTFAQAPLLIKIFSPFII